MSIPLSLQNQAALNEQLDRLIVSALAQGNVTYCEVFEANKKLVGLPKAFALNAQLLPEQRYFLYSDYTNEMIRVLTQMSAAFTNLRDQAIAGLRAFIEPVSEPTPSEPVENPPVTPPVNTQPQPPDSPPETAPVDPCPPPIVDGTPPVDPLPVETPPTEIPPETNPPVVEEPVVDQPIEEPVVDTPIVDELPVVETPTAEPVVGPVELPTDEPVAVDPPIEELPVIEQPIVAEDPTPPVVLDPVLTEPVVEEPITQPEPEQPVDASPSDDSPVDNAPPVSEEESPDDKASVDSTPVSEPENPSGNSPDEETTAAEEVPIPPPTEAEVATPEPTDESPVPNSGPVTPDTVTNELPTTEDPTTPPDDNGGGGGGLPEASEQDNSPAEEPSEPVAPQEPVEDVLQVTPPETTDEPVVADPLPDLVVVTEPTTDHPQPTQTISFQKWNSLFKPAISSEENVVPEEYEQDLSDVENWRGSIINGTVLFVDVDSFEAAQNTPLALEVADKLLETLDYKQIVVAVPLLVAEDSNNYDAVLADGQKSLAAHKHLAAEMGRVWGNDIVYISLGYQADAGRTWSWFNGDSSLGDTDAYAESFTTLWDKYAAIYQDEMPNARMVLNVSDNPAKSLLRWVPNKAQIISMNVVYNDSSIEPETFMGGCDVLLGLVNGPSGLEISSRLFGKQIAFDQWGIDNDAEGEAHPNFAKFIHLMVSLFKRMQLNLAYECFSQSSAATSDNSQIYPVIAKNAAISSAYQTEYSVQE